jgi:hypothetical protein
VSFAELCEGVGGVVLICGIDPEGDFVEAIGRNFTVEQASKVINDHIADWRGPIKKD